MSHAETRDIPAALRAAVDERDGQTCRFCGTYLGDRRVVHHIRYGGDQVGTGGRRQHTLDNLITLCGPWDNDCHAVVHADKLLWQHILVALTKLPGDGVTALQYRRWARHAAEQPA